MDSTLCTEGRRADSDGRRLSNMEELCRGPDTRCSLFRRAFSFRPIRSVSARRPCAMPWFLSGRMEQKTSGSRRTGIPSSPTHSVHHLCADDSWPSRCSRATSLLRQFRQNSDETEPTYTNTKLTVLTSFKCIMLQQTLSLALRKTT